MVKAVIIKEKNDFMRTELINDKLLLNEEKLTAVGKVIAVSISKKKGIPKTNINSARLIENYGIEGDIHAGTWHRQVSFLSVESIRKMRNSGLPKLRPGAFAENITTEFLDLPSLKIGTRVKLGEQAILEITQIGKECHSKCAIFIKVGDLQYNLIRKNATVMLTGL